MVQKPKPPQLDIAELEVKRLKNNAGLFFEGPISANNWQSISKLNSGLIQKGTGVLKNVQSIINDKDHVDFTAEE